jgi:predicted RNA polymerase sigma factor
VLSKGFGLGHVEVAEDIASDTFLLAAEIWGKLGIPIQPRAWRYTIAKNKTKDYFKCNKILNEKAVSALQGTMPAAMEIEID